MTDDRAVRMAGEFGALVTAVRRFVEDEKHFNGCRCRLCVELARIDAPRDRKVTT